MHWMLSTLYVCSILPFLPGAGGRGFSSSYSIYLSNRDIDKFWCNLSSTAGWNRGRILILSVLAWCSPGFFSLFTIKTSSLCMQKCATLLTLPRVLESMLLLLIYVAYPVSSLLFLWTQNPTTHYFKCSTIMNTFPFIVMTPTLMTTLCFHADVTGVFWCSILIYVRKWMLKVLPRLPLLQRKWEAPCVCAYVLAFMQ